MKLINLRKKAIIKGNCMNLKLELNDVEKDERNGLF
jgi:hypothetical protein